MYSCAINSQAGSEKLGRPTVEWNGGTLISHFETEIYGIWSSSKIAYSGDAKPASREALGQILEYNHYPPRKSYDHWVLVIDCRPNASDFYFLRNLRSLGLSISFGWPVRDGFDFSEDCPLYKRS
jgi:hypothetical protein